MSPNVTRRNFLTSSVAGIGLTTLGSSGGTTNAAPRSAMPLRPLGKTGQMVSLLAFGGGSRYADILKDEDEAERMINRAIELGVNYFDTAFDYGEDQKSQKRYGKYLTPSYRSRIFLSSKSSKRDADGYLREVEQSLKNLNTDHIDLLHFHGVDEQEDFNKLTASDGAVGAARKLVEEKVIRFIGWSTHRNADVHIAAIDRIGPDVMMFPCNAAREQELLQRVLPYALGKGVGVMAMKTTAQDKLIGKGGATAPELVRYAMGLPVSGTVVGMPSMQVLESCCAIARSFKPMSDEEKTVLEKKVAAAPTDGSLYYLCPGYRDGRSV
ncbi:aldo/keto reductase [bacterium]|nr:aldo/keto reductase [bacterium]